ncbi:DUF6344 domain-containing protein [Streptomyces sp. NBC_00820]|uniref:DUF6344 domain-containing protein n=1 Tax=Streptomyces sp. NBC_00820 TaxID=2975842 RepID=UPI002ED117F4|nr:DUF6344 domain-containing protein [Streptomyces sp. NBC_00820]
MTQNKVMTLWTAIVTAFLALCTALGLVTTAATTASAQTESPRTETPQSDSDSGTELRTAPTIPAMRHWTWSHAKALPPTMKQRIRAEAHGKSPRCRHLPLADAETDPLAQTDTEADALTDQRTAPLAC